MIKFENGKSLYFDKNGAEIVAGSRVKYKDGEIRKVYLTADGMLGTDATNPGWIASGRAGECEYGIYPLTSKETDEVEVVCE